MASPLILAIDQGTSSTKCLLVDATGRAVAQGNAPLTETTPHPGWVEQDALAIWESVKAAVADCLAGQDISHIVGVGIANQRESILAWDRATGKPLSTVLNWRDSRSGALIEALRTEASESLVFDRSGLPLDSMFSAAKARWILDEIDPDRTRATKGEIVLGTVDSFLLSRFGGEAVIEIGNASRTQLLNVREARWDDALCALFSIPLNALPRVVKSTGPFPSIRGLSPLPDGLPVLAVMGDSHSALFAHGAFSPGPVKTTLGTGSSIMGVVEPGTVTKRGLCLSIGWAMDEITFAAEGNIRSTGATLKWTAELFGRSTDDIVKLAQDSTADGVVIVPGFTGLGAPWWDRQAVGLISNLSVGSGAAQIARAAFESIPQQIADVVSALAPMAGGVSELLVDGGPSRNDALVQLLADLTGCVVERSGTAELSALGVAHLAGLAANIWTLDDLAALPRSRDRFSPNSTPEWRHDQRMHWRQAVRRARLAPETKASKEDRRPRKCPDSPATISLHNNGRF